MKRELLLLTLALALPACASTQKAEEDCGCSAAAAEAVKAKDGVAVIFEPANGIAEGVAKSAEGIINVYLSANESWELSKDGPAILHVLLTPLKKEAYEVELNLARPERRTRQRSFKIRPGENLDPELKRQLGILLPGPKHAKYHTNDLSSDEVDAGYKRLHEKLHGKGAKNK